MGLLFLIACLASTALVFGEEEHVHYGMIEICGEVSVKYVKPGDDFNIQCKSDHAIGTKIYTPAEDIPTKEELLEDADHSEHGHGTAAERTTTVIEYEDATKGEDDGWYTCVVQHGPGFDVEYSTAKCLVIILDLCKEAECEEAEVCEPDYEAGTYECTCNYGCPQQMDPVCSDTCEMYWNECVMNEESCKDRKARSVESKGFCPGKIEPKFRHINQDIQCELGETITLASGMIKDGTPRAGIQWVFYPEQGSATYLDVIDNYEVECSKDAAGVYKITLMHCMDDEKAVRNEYRLTFIEPPTDDAEHVCTSYPGGVIEDFNSDAHFYDLSCTHILAADLMPGGDYTNPWFIYGTYDQLDGKTALYAMLFYMSTSVFELQRGWILRAGDGMSKVPLKEGVPYDLEGSGCFVVFSEPGMDSVSKRHLRLVCPHINLEAYYDGIMSGHIKFTTKGEESDLVTSAGNVGLCYNSNPGWRTNWQIGRTDGECKVDGDNKECSDPAPDSCDLTKPAKDPDYSWTTCGDGASEACNELHCEGAVPSPAQKCALEQANRLNCDLKTGKDYSKVDESCPEDDCEWMEYVASIGCLQENLPFVCPRV